MTPEDAPRPGSALSDLDLRTAWLERLCELESRAATGGRKHRWRLEEAVDIWSVLAAYPWQRLNYRYGRWQAAENPITSLLTLTIWETYYWSKDDSSFQLLDPYTGKKLTEMPAWKCGLQMPGGTLEFAGDPTSIGVFRPVGGGVETIRLGWNYWVNLGMLQAGITALRAGADKLPLIQPVDLDWPDQYRVWFVDGPDKPRRKAPNSKALDNYRPGRTSYLPWKAGQ